MPIRTPDLHKPSTIGLMDSAKWQKCQPRITKRVQGAVGVQNPVGAGIKSHQDLTSVQRE